MKQHDIDMYVLFSVNSTPYQHLMKQELVTALVKALSENGIKWSKNNPLKVSIANQSRDIDLSVTFPLNEELEASGIRNMKISDLNLSTLSRNALVNANLLTVGAVLDRVERDSSCRSLLRLRNFGNQGLRILRCNLWEMGLVLSDKWRMTWTHDYSWDTHFQSSKM